MKFSIITATHLKNSFLEELYDSLLEQTHTDWEWILHLNGTATASQIEMRIRSDSRVKISINQTDSNKVGYLKNVAFHLGQGDVLVEVDHDDVLTADCLAELNVAFRDDTVGFVYSDNAIYHMTGEFVPYDPTGGWTYKTINWKNKNLISMDSFEPNSRSLAFIWYAPDHVRAWRTSVYKAIGGHDASMSICDDHDLMIRTYLNAKMFHIPKALYVYRITGDNTWLERNADIQKTTVELFHKYAWELACKDARDAGLKIVDIGGGINPRAGCDLTIDQEDGDIICDLNEGIPLPDNSVGVINASHVLEHLKDPLKSMREIHRVLADGGWAFIEVPSTDGRGAWQDPTHISYWNENSFWYYTRAEKAAFIRNKTIRFQEFRLDTVWWDNHIAATNAWLVAIKSEERKPHLKRI